MIESSLRGEIAGYSRDQSMIDTMTQKRLNVWNHGTAGSYLRLTVSLLGNLRRILDPHEISYELDDDFVSIDGGPEGALINFGRSADPQPIQAILDGAD